MFRSWRRIGNVEPTYDLNGQNRRYRERKHHQQKIFSRRLEIRTYCGCLVLLLLYYYAVIESVKKIESNRQETYFSEMFSQKD